MRWLIDGYNLIRRDPDLRDREIESLEAGRRALLHLLARAYRDASDQDRRKLDLLLSLKLNDALRAGGSLQELMREVSRKAQERGLTPEALESILNES